jgi:hypothetical protein
MIITEAEQVLSAQERARLIERPWAPEPGGLSPYEWEQIRRERGPMWPLCDDYDRLDEDAKRRERIRVVMDQGNPLKMSIAWDMFRRLYLEPTEPGFFYHDHRPSPPFHYEMLYDLGRYGRNIYAAPRGTAKSIVIGTEVPLFLALTRPYIRIVVAMATDKLVEQRFDLLISQLTENPFILADFGPQKPKRGDKTWNHHYLGLKNGSTIMGISVMGKKRGQRPDLFLLDDPEFDPTSEVSAIVIREKFVSMLFKQIIPMLERGSAMFWIGTMIGSKSLLYTACYGDDPRFDLWNRRVLSLENVDEKGNRQFLWESKYDKGFADVRRKEVGDSIYEQEYMNRKGSDSDRILKIDKVKNLYWTNGYIDPKPLESLQSIQYFTEQASSGNWIKQEEILGPWAKRLYRIIATDTAKGTTQYHDYSCIAVIGFDSGNYMWVLDLWMARCKDVNFLEMLFQMGMKWQPRIVGIESFSEQKKIVDAATVYLKEKAVNVAGEPWIPRVLPIDYRDVKGPKSKADRIRTLEWRFQQGRIKYLANCETRWPWSALFAQTLDFTYDLGLLPFDDAIDTVAQGHYIVHGKGCPAKIDPESHEKLYDKFKAGQIKFGSLPILQSVGSQGVTEEILEMMEKRSAEKIQELKDQDRLIREGKRGYYVGRERYNRG